MRTDTELQQSVLKALDWEPSVNAAQIGVTAQHGIVTLTGRVDALREKWMAEKTARHVWGVRGIANELAVAPDGESVRDDTSIAGAAVCLTGAWMIRQGQLADGRAGTAAQARAEQNARTSAVLPTPASPPRTSAVEQCDRHRGFTISVSSGDCCRALRLASATNPGQP